MLPRQQKNTRISRFGLLLVSSTHLLVNLEQILVSFTLLLVNLEQILVSSMPVNKTHFLFS
ncbi:hypothetical protein QUF86_02325 [Peribacillus sp. NJ11]|uniref:hypothetical protein n=1 Tax=Peribacillus sp. NJ11 TaxID=3055861 RepID=UPI0025A21EF8|nr:hypothetical protein [Peribacillus sp. NJ11]MDM5219654.1 hypothetical protein [Peribacillus sp. NJ11]